LKGKKIVVTGGAGFIGSNLAREFSKNNEIIIIDDLSTGNRENVEDLMVNKIDFIKGSVTELTLLEEAFENVDYVFHEAAIPSVSRSIKEPIQSHETNITGTLNVLLAAKDNKVKKVIYASSSSVYGDTPTLPKNEDMTPCPLSPYAVSKLTGEYYCIIFMKIFGLNTVCLRYFNVYGPYQDPTSEYAAVIPKFITCVNNDKSLVIYGDGKQTRDFTFISDVVEANILAVVSNSTGIFNIASGVQITIDELSKMILKIADKNVDIHYDDPRPGDIKHSLADISKARRELNYSPQHQLKSGLKETIKWFQGKNR